VLRIRIRDGKKVRIQIREKHTGSATLDGWTHVVFFCKKVQIAINKRTVPQRKTSKISGAK